MVRFYFDTDSYVSSVSLTPQNAQIGWQTAYRSIVQPYGLQQWYVDVSFPPGMTQGTYYFTATLYNNQGYQQTQQTVSAYVQ
jgi:hypothetical protein